MHDVWGFAAIFATILAGMYFNDRGLDKLEGRVAALDDRMGKGFDKIESRLDRMQAGLSRFYRDLLRSRRAHRHPGKEVQVIL